ncbi:hypothetical protein [Pseudanabaena sp. lw0831]|uniref:hypothetical protein n=1 Tax=Pseudanabaena sp. lw0831 TaxID=1357935 RepID=UPI00191560D1|nr:hypothetical protein [Pseudanabaena sp. lw0831]
MKIIEHSPKQLVIYSRPIGLWLISALFPLIGLFIGILSLEANFFSCNRIEKNVGFCQKLTVKILGIRAKQTPLQQIISAEVKQKSYPQEGTYYRVEINTTEGAIPLKDFWEGNGFDAQNKQEIASQINHFLKNHDQASIAINQYPNWFSLVWFLGWMYFSLQFFFGVAQIRTCTFDKTLNILIIEVKGLMGKKIDEYPLSQISNIIVSGGGISFNAIPTEPVHIILNSSEQISVYLALDSFSAPNNWYQKAQETVDLIQVFLGIPIEIDGIHKLDSQK